MGVQYSTVQYSPDEQTLFCDLFSFFLVPLLVILSSMVDCFCFVFCFGWQVRKDFIDLLGPLRDLLDRDMRIRVLKSVPLLASLSDTELDAVSHELCVECFGDGDYIVRYSI